MPKSTGINSRDEPITRMPRQMPSFPESLTSALMEAPGQVSTSTTCHMPHAMRLQEQGQDGRHRVLD